MKDRFASGRNEWANEETTGWVIAGPGDGPPVGDRRSTRRRLAEPNSRLYKGTPLAGRSPRGRGFRLVRTSFLGDVDGCNRGLATSKVGPLAGAPLRPNGIGRGAGAALAIRQGTSPTPLAGHIAIIRAMLIEDRQNRVLRPLASAFGASWYALTRPGSLRFIGASEDREFIVGI